MSNRPKDWAISEEEARRRDREWQQRISDENRALRADLHAMTAEKEKWRIRCAQETTAWSDEAASTARLAYLLRSLVSDWQANSGSRSLGEGAVARAWNEAASQLLEALDSRAEIAADEFRVQITAERERQIAQGWGWEHDKQHGPDHLLLWSQDYARRGRLVQSAALVEAARELLAGEEGGHGRQ